MTAAEHAHAWEVLWTRASMEFAWRCVRAMSTAAEGYRAPDAEAIFVVVGRRMARFSIASKERAEVAALRCPDCATLRGALH